MLRLVLILVVVVFGAFWALQDAFVALVLYTWFALFRVQEWVWTDISGLRLSLILGGILLMTSLRTGAWPDLAHPLSRGMIGVAFFALIAQVNAVNPDVGWYWTSYLLKLVLVCLLAVRILGTRRQVEIFVLVMAGSLGFHTAKAGLVSLMGGGVRFEDGLGGAFSTNNGFAMGAAMVTFLLLSAGFLVRQRWLRRMFWIAAPMSAYTVVSTFSRGGFLGLAAGVFAYILCQRRKRIRYLIGLTLVGIIGLAVIPLPSGYMDRLQTIDAPEGGRDESAASRLYFWGVALDMAAQNPLGVGLRNFSYAYDSFDRSGGKYGRERDCHSSYLQMLSEVGFAGCCLYLWLLGYSWRILLRVRSRFGKMASLNEDGYVLLAISNGLIGMMAAYMVGGAFGSYALNDLTWLGFAATAALDRVSGEVTTGAVGDTTQREESNSSKRTRDREVGLEKQRDGDVWSGVESRD